MIEPELNRIQDNIEKIKAIRQPKWCVNTEEGRKYWQLICAAINDDVETIQSCLTENPSSARLEYWYTPPIHFAVREGNLAATQILWQAYQYEEVNKLVTVARDRGYLHIIPALTSFEDIHLQRDEYGRSDLHLAVLEGDISAIQNIIKRGSSLDTTDQFGFRPIHYACWHNQYWKPKENTSQIIDILLQAGAADSPSLAAFRGEQKALQAFIQQDPRFANDGDTLEKRPLSTAVEKDHKAMVRYLLDHGADPKLAEGRCCPHGSALMTASTSNQLEVARWLLEAGADPNGYIDSSATPTIRAPSDEMRRLLYIYGGQGENAWGLAQRGELGALASILRYCDDPFSNEAEEFLTTPYTAIISGWKRCHDQNQSTIAHEAMFEMFLRRKHPMPTVLTACKTYLYHVGGMTKRLLENGLDPNLPDWLGRTPLHDICARNDGLAATKLVNMFLEHGADIEAIDDEDCSTPLGMASREGDVRLVQLLIERGANVNGGGAEWAAPLSWAKRRQRHQVIEILKSHGAV